MIFTGQTRIPLSRPILSVIIKAKINGVIPSIKPILTKIKETDFRLSADLERQALLAASEL